MSRTLCFILGAATVLAAPGSVFAATYDLAADWSNAANPNGPWAYLVGGSVAGNGGPRTGDPFNPPGPPQIWGSGWHGWSQSIGTEAAFPQLDVQAGDVYGHHSGPTQILWTSPFAGPAEVSGGVWALRDIGRYTDWQLLYNGTQIASGKVQDGDPYNRANPMPIFESLNLAVGDQIRFSADGNADYVGVNLRISPIPEPEAAAGLACVGLLGFAFYRRMRSRG